MWQAAKRPKQVNALVRAQVGVNTAEGRKQTSERDRGEMMKIAVNGAASAGRMRRHTSETDWAGHGAHHGPPPSRSALLHWLGTAARGVTCTVYGNCKGHAERH